MAHKAKLSISSHLNSLFFLAEQPISRCPSLYSFEASAAFLSEFFGDAYQQLRGDPSEGRLAHK